MYVKATLRDKVGMLEDITLQAQATHRMHKYKPQHTQARYNINIDISYTI